MNLFEFHNVIYIYSFFLFHDVKKINKTSPENITVDPSQVPVIEPFWAPQCYRRNILSVTVTERVLEVIRI